MNNLPFEIISMFLKFMDLITQIKFISTCKNFWNMVDYHNHIPVNYYKGIATVLSKTIYHLIRDDLNIHSDIISDLIITFKYTGPEIHCMKFNLPNLTTLILHSTRYVVLENWTMPNLKKLNIVKCNNCILDGCVLPSLAYLYINQMHQLPLRFCELPKNSRIIQMTLSGKNIKNSSYEYYVKFERQQARKELYKLPNLDLACFEKCLNCVICDHPLIVIANNLVCRGCKRSRPISLSMANYINQHPQCKECDQKLLIYMHKYGYALGFCYLCHKNIVLNRLDAYCARKINGIDVYPRK